MKVWNDAEFDRLKEICRECSSFKELREKAAIDLPNKSWRQIQKKLENNPEYTKYFIDKRKRWRVIKVEESFEKKKKELTIEEKSFPAPEVWEVSAEAYKRPGVRIGLFSGANYKEDGFRAGLIRLGRDLTRQEGTHFDIWNAGLVSKKWIAKELKRRCEGIHRDLHPYIVENFLTEAAQELNSIIPKIKKPRQSKENGKYIRLYIMTSPTRDGPLGEEIARRLQKLRSEDIRCYRAGGDRLPVKQPGKGRNKLVWVINPHKSRLPSKYHSQVAEREIDDKRRQTTKKYPDLWVVGPFASNIHKPQGERKEPYVTMGVLRRLEEVLEAENQISVSIVEYTPQNDRFVRVWDLKDIVARELENITGIKAGAEEIHQKIVEVIKERRPVPIGIIADELKWDRKTLEKKIKFLVEEKKSPRKTWPGLYYNPSSQCYDFHLDWVQDRLSYPRIDIHDKNFAEDRILFIGCPHVGYTTTDYEFIVKDIPEIILKHNIKTLPILGDIIAGLRYSYLHTGEVFGDLNNTDQEKLAAELFGTVIMKVFMARIKKRLAGRNAAELSQLEAKTIILESLLDFPYIPGNHDLWQESEGTAPLETFSDKLSGLLVKHLSAFLFKKSMPSVDIFEIISQKLIKMPDYDAIYRLPSGLNMEMYHPHTARADTTSLRAQKALENSNSQVVGVANFHTATVVHNWYSDRGQCVAVQIGTLVIYTRFEERKTKRIDFGPVFLRVLSKNQRIIMTESAYFNKPRLKKPLSKWTNLDQLKKNLGILDAP
ncbi:MAG: hypothetical protein DRZ76_00445 [Candidatus Nealsonbacteria bacterium]|nr:MAG: hypothetical protein DRZ76_00445 [Candidatus Nealsonbacteria bacterium]